MRCWVQDGGPIALNPEPCIQTLKLTRGMLLRAGRRGGHRRGVRLQEEAHPGGRGEAAGQRVGKGLRECVARGACLETEWRLSVRSLLGLQLTGKARVPRVSLRASGTSGQPSYVCC